MGAQCSQDCDSQCRGAESEFSPVEAHKAALSKAVHYDENDGSTTPPPMSKAAMDVGAHKAEDADEAPKVPGYFDREVPELSLVKSRLPTDSGRRPAYTFATQAVYDGEWKGNLRHGFGRQIWPDGTQYEGQWRDSQAHGYGRFTHSNGDAYIGCWRANVAHGLGSYYKKGVVTYAGEWVGDLQEGSGVEMWQGGENARYEGDFRGGFKEGSGVYTWADGSEYRGTWRNNAIDGHGVYIGNDGRWFKGEWKDAMMHGYGMYSWPDGREFCGQYLLDKKQGFGRFTWGDGRKYEGMWRAGKQHGRGTYRGHDGVARIGDWIDGKRQEDIPRQMSNTQSSGKGIIKSRSMSRSGFFVDESPRRPAMSKVGSNQSLRQLTIREDK